MTLRAYAILSRAKCIIFREVATAVKYAACPKDGVYYHQDYRENKIFSNERGSRRVQHTHRRK